MKYLLTLFWLLILFLQAFSDNPPYLKIVFPEHGFKQIPSNDTCAVPQDVNWQYAKFDDVILAVYADGPDGSGHFWQIFIGLTRTPQTLPRRGVCLETSTIGWHYRQLPGSKPLFWLKDLDEDKKPELILWDSIPLYQDSVYVSYTLVAWVFKFDGKSTFIFQKELSEKLNKQLVPARKNAQIKAAPYLGGSKFNTRKSSLLIFLDSLLKKMPADSMLNEFDAF